jgi:hypothetical protein
MQIFYSTLFQTMTPSNITQVQNLHTHLIIKEIQIINTTSYFYAKVMLFAHMHIYLYSMNDMLPILGVS